MTDDAIATGTNPSDSEHTTGDMESSAWSDGKTVRFAVVGSDRRAQKLAISLLEGNTQISILTPDAKSARIVLNELGERLDQRSTTDPITYTREALQKIRVIPDLHRMGRHSMVFLFQDKDTGGVLEETLVLVEASVSPGTPVAVILSVDEDHSTILANAPNPERIVPVYSLLPEFEGSVFFPVRTETNTDAIFHQVVGSLKSTGHTVLTTSQEDPRGTIGEVLASWMSEALRWLDEGRADIQTIDELFRLGGMHGLGPLQLADLMGLDFALSALKVVNENNPDSLALPLTPLVSRVEAGALGWKSGSGFYAYEQTELPD